MAKAVWAIESLVELFAKLAAFLVLALSCLVVYDSVNRYLFNNGSVGLPINIHLLHNAHQ